ncbi:MAG TPA: DUF1330 domain-containing protein [Burkholderiales bacterium]|jgi:uncharacterized protein (DUF1330 family)|nr:DUF1330 domain-containing protein [Burkholderiales bacterium]
MAKAYLVVTYRAINDQEKWSAYAKLAAPAMQKAGGRYIVRGMPSKTYEKGMNQRVVILEFDSVDKATAAHESADYQVALRALGDGADRDMRLVEGLS